MIAWIAIGLSLTSLCVICGICVMAMFRATDRWYSAQVIATLGDVAEARRRAANAPWYVRVVDRIDDVLGLW